MTQKILFDNLTGDTLTIGNTVITGTGVTVNNEELEGSVTTYANTSVLPLTNLTAGDFAFVDSNNALYFTNGSGWYLISGVNRSPTVSLSSVSISLGSSANTADITYTVSEPEGTPVTVTVSDSVANTSLANVQHYTSNNTIRINNVGFTTSNAFTVTVSASDGVNTGTATANVDLSFATSGQQIFTSSSTFTVPDGITVISAVAVGSGARAHQASPVMYSGGGGALAYSNHIPVTAGETLTITKSGTGSTDGSYIQLSRGATVLLKAVGGEPGTLENSVMYGGQASSCVGQVRRSGGNGTSFTNPDTSYPVGVGGGGAAGYTGNGNTSAGGRNGKTGILSGISAGGGGIGLQGTSVGSASTTTAGGAYGGLNGNGNAGGNYGGGGGGSKPSSFSFGYDSAPNNSAIRIIWDAVPQTRSFPSNAADV